jgi:nucleotide-binding universal stress UspA family protein
MRKILLAVGDTTTSLQTARHIRPWLRERQTSLTLMSVARPGTLFPLSHVQRALEQAEAIFVSAEEQPGIVVRVGNDPAAELCHETRQNKYDLLAIGLRSQYHSNGPIGVTCRAVLNACPAPMFVAPPTMHTSMTPQVMFVVDRSPPPAEIAQWLIAQCQAQKLNAVLCAEVPDKTALLEDTLASAGIRTQLALRSPLSPSVVHALAQDRRVRWIVLPIQAGPDGITSPQWVEALLGQASYPVLLVPDTPSAQKLAPCPVLW